MRHPCAFTCVQVVFSLSLAASSIACAGDHTQLVTPASPASHVWHGQNPQALPTLPDPGDWPGTTAANLPGVPEPRAPVTSNQPPPREPRAPTTMVTIRQLDAATIPDGKACLKQLTELGVAFHEGPKKRGMKTPVVVDGPLGGIAYRGLYGVPFLCDCRLAVALSWVGPDWRAAGISEVFFSGAYNYRMSRVGRLSLHAWGLAIDVHEVTAHGKHLTVSSDFARGTGDCGSAEPLNVVACRLRARGMFRELLTPDYDADHHDHLHISIKPHGEDPVVRHAPKRRAKTAASSAEPSSTQDAAPRRGKHRVKPRQAATDAESTDASKPSDKEQPKAEPTGSAPSEQAPVDHREPRSKHRSKGSPAEPAKPPEPAKPAQPAKPPEPAKPAEPAEPAKPVEPVDPVEPAKPETQNGSNNGAMS